MKNFISQKPLNEKTILGIDPGSQKLGWGLIFFNQGKMNLIDRGLIQAKMYKTTYFDRLKIIGDGLEKILKKRKPSEIIIEDLYMKKINIQAALTIGKTFGYILAICEKSSPRSKILPMHASAARTLLGNRSMNKESTRFSVASHLEKRELESENLDITDALALAIARGIEDRGHFF